MSIEVLLDTPNSKTNRKFSLNVQGALKPQKQLNIIFVSPFKQATFDGKLYKITVTPDYPGMIISWNIRDKIKFWLKQRAN